ncbi:hypothetical protein BH18ACI4_BH18ACI4_01690 [soil metagenome]
MRLLKQWCVVVACCVCMFHTAASQEWRRTDALDRGSNLVGWVHGEKLNWRPFLLPGVRQSEFKLLSLDHTTKARSQLMRVPVGWAQPTGYHSADLEIFLLEGGISIGDKRLGKYSYAYFPAGTAYGPISTEYGATILQWWAGVPDFTTSSQSIPGANARKVVIWPYGSTPSMSPSEFPKFSDRTPWANSPVRLTLIRRDESSGQMVWIAAIPGGGKAMSGEGEDPLWTSSPSWQEGMLLAGDMTIGECLAPGEVVGSYRPGGYFFRPGNMRHGGRSLYSETYSLWLFRSGKSHWVDYFNECDNPKRASKPATSKEATGQ